MTIVYAEIQVSHAALKSWKGLETRLSPDWLVINGYFMIIDVSTEVRAQDKQRSIVASRLPCNLPWYVAQKIDV